jgi:hypothetical protein
MAALLPTISGSGFTAGAQRQLRARVTRCGDGDGDFIVVCASWFVAANVFFGTVLVGAARRRLGIKHHHLGAGETALDGGEEFFGVEIGKTAVEKQDLPVSFLQLGQRVGAAQGLLHRTAAPVQPMHDLLAQRAVRARDQGSAGVSEEGHGGHGAHVQISKSARLR